MLKRMIALLCAAVFLLAGGCVEAVVYSFEAERDLSIVFTNEDEFYYFGGASAFAADTAEPVKLDALDLALDVALTDTTAVFITADGLYGAGTIADLPFGDASTLETDGIVKFVYSQSDAALEENAKLVSVDLSTAQQVVSGSNFTLVRLLDGRICGWGSNAAGQLGVSADEMFSSNVPVRIGELEGVSLLAASSGGLCAAVDMDGHVWVWGDGLDGMSRLDIEQIVHVVCGDGFVAMLDVNAKVWYCEPESDGAPAQVAGLPEVYSLVAGDDFLAAKDGDGGVWTWGENDVGQLGRDTGGAADYVPTKVEGLDTVISLSAGRAHVMAMTQNMAIFLWGDNSAGQLGIEAEYSAAPIAAPKIRMSLSR